MEEPKKWLIETKLNQAANSLDKNGIKAFIAKSKNEVKDLLLNMIPADAEVGVGGSVTLREIGLVQALEERGNPVFQHWKKGISKEEQLQIRKKQLSCKYFITSTNAVTLNGELVNKDGSGNRAGSMFFGPENVIVIAGYNKIAVDIHDAFRRIENYAAPQNAKRLSLKTPCAVTGYCSNCDSPDRQCRITTIISKKPHNTNISVVLVAEPLGY